MYSDPWKVEVRFIDARFYRLNIVFVDPKETLRLSRRKETMNIGTKIFPRCDNGSIERSSSGMGVAMGAAMS